MISLQQSPQKPHTDAEWVSQMRQLLKHLIYPTYRIPMRFKHPSHMRLRLFNYQDGSLLATLDFYNWNIAMQCLQCFDAVGWAAGRASQHPACKKLQWWGTGVVICPERDADLHMAQLMPLPLTVSCFSKIQIGFTFLVPAHAGSPGKRAVKRVCVCVCVKYCHALHRHSLYYHANFCGNRSYLCRYIVIFRIHHVRH